MITFMESKEKIITMDKCLDSQLWHACAGGMVQMPAVNSKVFYFPQGHAEHSCGSVDFRSLPRVPSYIPCRVSGIEFMADIDSDEVYAKLKLVPVSYKDVYSDIDEGGVINGVEGQDGSKPASFAKTLTQSDANNGGGFSVPRYCAETIFPRLDYSADPPVQTILAKDVHGETWKFRHIYRGTPRRHLLTTGWSTFVNHKKLVAGDSIVFLRVGNGDLCVGIRRAKRGIGGGPESSWNPAGGNCMVPYGGFAAFLREDENNIMRSRNGNGFGSSGGLLAKGKVKPESVIEAVTLAANGQPFEVVYYPRASTPEFCVKASLVKAAMQIRWCSGMRFKMAFETEDSSRISWFLGTISSVHFADPIRWPDSPWRLLQVSWDEPDLLQNVKRVSPWLVELVSNMSTIHLPPFSPQRKKLRLTQHTDFPVDCQFQMPTFPGNLLGHTSPLGCLSDNNPAGMQGARHAHYGLSLSDLHFSKLQTGLLPAGFPPPFDHAAEHIRASNSPVIQKPAFSEDVSCVLTMASSSPTSMADSTPASKKPEDLKPRTLLLFGQSILTEQQITHSCSGDRMSPVGTRNSSSEEKLEEKTNFSDGSGSAPHQQGLPERSSCEQFQESEPSVEAGQCKVLLESEDVGHTLDLSLLVSYDDLHRKLADMFEKEKNEALSNVLYCDANGAVKHTGDEPFSDFVRTARRLTILMDSSTDNVGK